MPTVVSEVLAIETHSGPGLDDIRTDEEYDVVVVVRRSEDRHTCLMNLMIWHSIKFSREQML